MPPTYSHSPKIKCLYHHFSSSLINISCIIPENKEIGLWFDRALERRPTKGYTDCKSQCGDSAEEMCFHT